MSVHHTPFGLHDGDELDCGPCRAALLDAFRPAPGETAPANAGPPPVLPHLIVGEEHSRTVDMRPQLEHCPTCVCTPERPCCACKDRGTPPERAEYVPQVIQGPDPAHVTTGRVYSYRSIPGGYFSVTCTCGWTVTDRWSPSQGPRWAAGRADAVARAHHSDPEKGPDQ